MDPRIRIHTKMSWICNTASDTYERLKCTIEAKSFSVVIFLGPLIIPWLKLESVFRIRDILVRFFSNFFCLFVITFWTVHLQHCAQKEVAKQQNQGIRIIFAWWWVDPDTDPYLCQTDSTTEGPKPYGSYGFGTLGWTPVFVHLQLALCGYHNKLSSANLIRQWDWKQVMPCIFWLFLVYFSPFFYQIS